MYHQQSFIDLKKNFKNLITSFLQAGSKQTVNTMSHTDAKRLQNTTFECILYISQLLLVKELTCTMYIAVLEGNLPSFGFSHGACSNVLHSVCFKFACLRYPAYSLYHMHMYEELEEQTTNKRKQQ